MAHEDVYANYHTGSESGLKYEQIASLRRRYGYNELPKEKVPVWRILLEPFKSIFVIILILAAILSLFSKETFDAIIVSFTLVVNAVIFYIQHASTNKVLHALEDKQKHLVSIIRDSNQQKILAKEILPGDIVLLSEGDKVPADCRIIHSNEFSVDESMLTGESLPVEKHSNPLKNKMPMNQQRNMAFMGCLVQSGEAKAIVTSIGAETEFGKIAHLASKTHEKSPVQHKIDKLATNMTKWLIVVSVFVFVLSLLRGISADEALRFMLSLTVSSVPEGLPLALTVFMVIGMHRMAKRKALVRSMTAIENLGILTAIATDKTGTLTKNQLAIEETWSPDKSSAEIIDSAYKSIHLKGVEPADPLDASILRSSKDKKPPKAIAYHPFKQHLRMSGATIETEGEYLTFLKGAPENILNLTKITALDRKKIEEKIHHYTSTGYRVIALGKIKTTKKQNIDLEEIIKNKGQFIGLLAIADQLRNEAKSAIVKARQAGLSVIMITGDHYDTAYEIGKKIGLVDNRNQVIEGDTLSNLTEKEMEPLVLNCRVIARVLPKDKYRILSVLKSHHITAMTGDGVNDVPALRNSHIGLAMGSGTDAAKEAGDIVILNDNFETVVTAVAEGRTIYANIQKMLFFLFSTTFGEVLSMIGSLLLGLPLPVTAAQILWINLVTSTPMILPLGMELPEDGYMSNPPRKPNAPILPKYSVIKTGFMALIISSLTLGAFYFSLRQGSLEEAQTVAFCVLAITQFANVFNARSETKSLLKLISKPNHFISIGLVSSLSLLVFVVFGPISEKFHIHVGNLQNLIVLCVLSAVTVIISGEIFKTLTKNSLKRA